MLPLPEVVPDPLRIPLPALRANESAFYEQLTEGPDGAMVRDGFWHLALSAPRVVPGPDASEIPVLPVQVTWYPNVSLHVPIPHEALLSIPSLEVVGTRQWSNTTGQVEHRFNRLEFLPYATPVIPCFIGHDASSLDPGRAIRFAPCPVRNPLGRLGADPFVPTGWTGLRDAPALVLRGNGSNAPEVVLDGLSRLPLRVTWMEGASNRTLLRREHSVGNASLDLSTHSAGAELPRLQLANRHSYGMPEGGVPFELSAKRALARAQLEARTSLYLQRNPEAVLHSVYVHDGREYDTRSLEWRLEWSAPGGGWLARVPIRTFVGSGVATPAAMGWSAAGPTVGTSVAAIPMEGFSLPAAAPVLASLLPRLRATAPGEATESILGWGMRTDCVPAPCSTLYSLTLGSARFPEREVKSYLELDKDGRVAALAWYSVAYDYRAAPQRYEPSPADLRAEQLRSNEGGISPFELRPLELAAASLVGAAALAWIVSILKGGTWVPGFSRLRTEALLDHPSRQQIVQLIAAHPGIHYKEIVRRMGQGHGKVEHHLAKLESAEIVRVERRAGRSAYFLPGDVDRAWVGARLDLRSRGAKQVLLYASRSPGCSASEVAREERLSLPTVTYHVRRLLERGYLLVERDGSGFRLRASPQGIEALGFARSA